MQSQFCSGDTASPQALSFAQTAENPSESCLAATVAFLREAQKRYYRGAGTDAERKADRALRERRKAETAPARLARKLKKSAARSKRYRDRQRPVIVADFTPAPQTPYRLPTETRVALRLALAAWIKGGSPQARQMKARAVLYMKAAIALAEARVELGADPEPAAFGKRLAERWGLPEDRMFARNVLHKVRSLEAPSGPWERDDLAMNPASERMTAGDEPSAACVTQSDEPSKAINPDRDREAEGYLLVGERKTMGRDGDEPFDGQTGFIAERHAFSL